MGDLQFGLTISGVVVLVVAVMAIITTAYCKWVERSDRDRQDHPKSTRAA